MPDRSRKRPRDPNLLAKAIVDIATGQIEDDSAAVTESGKNPAAVALGRLGGLKLAVLGVAGASRPEGRFRAV
ncbi:MAG TPA: hypothetical protein VEK75_11765 [Xanthobacteraceae bacterium]|nr:hypothetical protein [Xanthobacteraceae bacterium]